MAENEKKDGEEVVQFVLHGVGPASRPAYMSMTRAEYDKRIGQFETAETPGRPDLNPSRIDTIHMVTNLIEGSEITRIQDRDDATMLAIHIVDGIVAEAEKLAERISGS